MWVHFHRSILFIFVAELAEFISCYAEALRGRTGRTLFQRGGFDIIDNPPHFLLVLLIIRSGVLGFLHRVRGLGRSSRTGSRWFTLPQSHPLGQYIHLPYNHVIYKGQWPGSKYSRWYSRRQSGRQVILAGGNAVQ
ncbi:uncharacterized protein EI90DRAFT_262655 [Cantharellus anzutake]|uniref:uncharacterized protein n=1 Tax=Cantharellus anzutake TaxID=1750568 RepID=UPI0019063FC6|nr:uncharacterized protein EI90DRAFT_262655 [Cantharellus anzutake]KAF8335825.1 hypothetical protein EI90DRAFT_262655 [Cantharellus anzutake]